MGSQIYVLVCKSLIDFNKAFIPYNALQFFEWPSIVALVIGCIQFPQCFECSHVEEELT